MPKTGVPNRLNKMNAQQSKSDRSARAKQILAGLDLLNAKVHASRMEQRLAKLTAEGRARSADFFASQKAAAHLETFSLREYSL